MSAVVDRFGGDLYVVGNIGLAGTLGVPAGTITDAMVSSSAAIGFVKQIQGYRIRHTQTGTVANATEYFGIIYGATGALIDLQAAVTETIATGSDRTVTIDLLKSTSGGAFASVLSSTLVLDHTNTIRTAVAATISAASLVAGDILKLTVAVAGSAGNQALGLAVALTLSEAPQ